MNIKITRLELKKDVSVPSEIQNIMRKQSYEQFKLQGNLYINVNEGIINANQELPIENISEKLQNELYEVLNKIERELNGLELVGQDVYGRPIYRKKNNNSNESLVELPKGTPIIPNSEAKEILKEVEGNKEFLEKGNFTINITVNENNEKRDVNELSKLIMESLKKMGK